MKKMTLGLIASMMFFPAFSFAQSNSQSMPQPPAAWVTFEQQENSKRAAFFKQMNEDRQAFLSQNPEVKTYLDQMRAASQARMAAWRAAHQNKNPLNPAFAPHP